MWGELEKGLRRKLYVALGGVGGGQAIIGTLSSPSTGLSGSRAGDKHLNRHCRLT